jgi:hypothetical protein
MKLTAAMKATTGRSEFEAQLVRIIQTAISKLPAGTVGVSRDCLWQLIRIPSNIGPKGPNAAWIARQLFNEIVAQPAFAKFVYSDEAEAAELQAYANGGPL